MLEKPPIQDKQIITFLHKNYGIKADRLEFLPLGNDSNSWVYEVGSGSVSYFLKAKQGEIYPPSLYVPKYLNDLGLKPVVAPLPGRSGELWGRLDNFALILYPFVVGENGMEVGLSPEQWRDFGRVLKKIHHVELPANLSKMVERENFVLRWTPLLEKLHEAVSRVSFQNEVQTRLARFWRERAEEIEGMIRRAQRLGRELQARPLGLVLCHTDIHTANLLLSPTGEIHIVDWDYPMLAPKERDLRYMIEQGQLNPLFHAGYQADDIDPVALAYYHYEWVLQDLADYGERVFFIEGFGEETRQAAFEGFYEMFQPGNIIEMAYQVDPEQSRS